MFLENQPYQNKDNYYNTLKSMASFSNLFSESDIPYLSYRAVENIFCESLNADNLSRSDCSADASKDGIGIGIKTFLNQNGRSLQKVAEFNSDSLLFKNKTPKEIVKIVSNLRNKRIQATKRIHKLDNIIYHCVVRDLGKIKIFECPMDEINLSKIKNIIPNKTTIAFEDDKNEYSFNISKSTLYKRFITTNVIKEIDAKILSNPYEVIKGLNSNETSLDFEKINESKEYIFLPLFSDRGTRHVPSKSGLNQWNADGRTRNKNEVYIPIPSKIRDKFPNFFPNKNTSFNLVLPDKSIISAKVCQEGSKALMSNPNSALGKWILRQVLNLKEGELLTYDKLEELGLDSVVIYKEGNNSYSINFTELGSYDMFLENN